jgi:hypothetical protein
MSVDHPLQSIADALGIGQSTVSRIIRQVGHYEITAYSVWASGEPSAAYSAAVTTTRS